MYDYGARSYDAKLGRFISPDPIIPDFTNSQSLNRYSYVYNNPLKYTDPTGHFAQFLAPILAYLNALMASPDLPLDLQQIAFDLSRGDMTGAGMGAIGAVLPAVSSTTVKGAAKTASAAGDAIKVGAKTLSKEILGLAEANIKNTGKTVLGHWKHDYVTKAKQMGASYFDIGDAWNGLSEGQRKAANLHFLDKIAENGQQVFLATSKQRIDRPSQLLDETVYLTEEKGYKWINQWSLRPRSLISVEKKNSTK